MSGVIYVVDDDPAIRDVTRRMLERFGYTVQTMDSGAAAIAALHAHLADLVLLDVSLPDESGLQLCRRLKGNPAIARVPIVIVTGWNRPTLHQEAAGVGAADLLVKPFSIHELQDCVARNLARSGRRAS